MLILNESKMRLLTVNNDLARRPIPKRDAVNPLIANDTKGRDLIILQEDQKTLYKEYDLQEAVDACRVTTIKQVVEAQYIEEKRREYAGYNNETIHSLLSHVQPWDIITNRENIKAKDRFHDMWRKSPDQHITAFVCQMYTWQRDCAKQKT